MYGHAITKFPGMDRFTYPWCSAGALRAPELRYNESLRSQLDMYAPVLTRDINVRPLAAWFNEDIRDAKLLRRNAEKMWRATRLLVDVAAFKKERNCVVNLMNETRRVYHNQFIEDNSTDQRRLFAASKSLLNMKKDRSLPHILFHF